MSFILQKTKLLLILFFAALAGCTSTSADYKNICKLAKRRLDVKDKAEFFKEAEDQLRSDEGQKLWKSVQQASPENQYEVLLRGTKEIGIQDYKCDALKTLLSR